MACHSWLGPLSADHFIHLVWIAGRGPNNVGYGWMCITGYAWTVRRRPLFGLQPAFYSLQPAFIPLSKKTTHLVPSSISFIQRDWTRRLCSFYPSPSPSFVPSHTHYKLPPSPFHPPFSMLLETRRLTSSRSTGGSVTHSSTRCAITAGSRGKFDPTGVLHL